MTQHILVAYASRAGSTAEVAETIAQVLREGGAEVDVCSVNRIRTVAGYDALVLGSAIWTGRPLPEALRFAASQRRALAELPVAYFALCEILRVDTPIGYVRLSVPVIVCGCERVLRKAPLPGREASRRTVDIPRPVGPAKY